MKSGYHVALRHCQEISGADVGASNPQPQRGFWKTIWSLGWPNKVKLLLWRARSNILPAAQNLFWQSNPICLRCG